MLRAGSGYHGNGELLQWLDERGIAAYIRVKENPNGPTDLYGIDQFTYRPEENSYICPEGKILKYVGINARNRTTFIFRRHGAEAEKAGRDSSAVSQPRISHLKKWWPGTKLNRRRQPFQGYAQPT